MAMPPPSEWPTTVASPPAEHDEQVAETGRVGAQRVVAAWLGRLAVAQQVRREDGVAIGELRDDIVPLPRVARDPVNQQDHRPLAGRAVGNAMPVEDGFPDARLEIVGPPSVAALRTA